MTNLCLCMIVKNESKIITECLKELDLVSEKTKADYLLTLFLRKKVHIAIVKDSFGATQGVVTLEDALASGQAISLNGRACAASKTSAMTGVPSAVC